MTDHPAYEHAGGAGRTGQSGDGPAHGVDALFQRAEHTGLRLAIIGRTLALACLGTWLVLSRASDPARALDYALVVAAFAALGLLHYALIGSRFDRAWIKYAFAVLDIAALSLMIATQPLYASADLSPMMLYRATVFEFYFLVLRLAAFSFSPGAVLWTDIAGALGWLGAYSSRAYCSRTWPVSRA